MSNKWMLALVSLALIGTAVLAGCAEPEEEAGPVEEEPAAEEPVAEEEEADVGVAEEPEPDVGAAEEPGAEGDETPIVEGEEPADEPGADLEEV